MSGIKRSRMMSAGRHSAIATQPDQSVLRLEDGPPLAVQHLLRQAPHGRIVVHDEHRRRWSGITQLPSSAPQ